VPVTIDKFLEDTTTRHASLYAEEVSIMLAATVTGNEAAARDATKRFREVIRETMGVADILGTNETLRAAASVLTTEMREELSAQQVAEVFHFATQTIVPKITFAEALADMVDRAPTTLKDAAERSAEAIARLYSEDNVVAFVRSAEDAVTEKAQDVIAQAIKKGIGEVKAGRLLKATVDEVRTELTDSWSESYATMAFRTNVSTATSAGRFRQVQDPDVAAVIPAFQFQAAGPPLSRGGDTRDNHYAAHQMILRTDNPAWGTLAPPLGYNCRCQAVMMSLPQLRRMKRINRDQTVKESVVPKDAFPDPGFRHGGRPDLFLGAA
jgi:SPP1 gp7 family putative phage head morphogenesis protein